MCHKNYKRALNERSILRGIKGKRYQAQMLKSSTLFDRFVASIALSPSDNTEMVRSFLGRTTSSCLVQIQVEAYILTLDNISFGHNEGLSRWVTYRSMQVPGKRAPTRRAVKPFSSKCLIYQGSILAERRRMRPPFFRARLSRRACAEASSPVGSNQSIESMT